MVDDQVRDNIHACPFIAPDEYRFVSSNSVGMRHPALPVIVELAQNELALSQVVKNDTGIQLSGLRTTMAALTAGAMHTPLVRTAGATHGCTHLPLSRTVGAAHTRASTVNTALVDVGL